jgi:hypothetical protein
VEAYNKIVKNEFLAVEDISSIDDGKPRYDMFVKAYNETREHGLTPSKTFNRSYIEVSLPHAFVYVIPHTRRLHYDLSITRWMKSIKEFIHLYQVIVHSNYSVSFPFRQERPPVDSSCEHPFLQTYF